MEASELVQLRHSVLLQLPQLEVFSVPLRLHLLSDRLQQHLRLDSEQLPLPVAGYSEEEERVLSVNLQLLNPLQEEDSLVLLLLNHRLEVSSALRLQVLSANQQHLPRLLHSEDSERVRTNLLRLDSPSVATTLQHLPVQEEDCLDRLQQLLVNLRIRLVNLPHQRLEVDYSVLVNLLLPLLLLSVSVSHCSRLSFLESPVD